MKKITTLVLVAAMLLLSLSACGKKVVELKTELPAEMAIGEILALDITVLPEDATDKALTYSSSDENVATVDNDGNVTAVAAGSVQITVQSTNKDVTLVHDLKVYIPVESVAAPDEIYAPPNGTIRLAADIEPQDAEHGNLTYTSADTSIATVDADGFVTGVSIGETTITTTSENGKTATTKVITVLMPEKISIDVDLSMNMRVDDTTTLNVIFVPEESANDKILNWSSSNEAVASVDENGLVTAIAVGITVIKATTINGISATCLVEVHAKSSSSGSSGGSGSTGSGSGSGSGAGSGSGSGGGTAPGQGGSLSDADIQSIVASARAYAESRGFSIVSGLQYSWPTPARISGTYDFLLSSVYGGVDYVYDILVQHEGEFVSGATISIEYIINGPGGTGIYVSY